MLFTGKEVNLIKNIKGIIILLLFTDHFYGSYMI